VLGHQSGDAVAPNLALPFEPLALRKAAVGLTAGGRLPQRLLLSAAPSRDDRCLILSGALKGAAVQRVAAKLFAAGLVKELLAKPGLPVWRHDKETGRGSSADYTISKFGFDFRQGQGGVLAASRIVLRRLGVAETADRKGRVEHTHSSERATARVPTKSRSAKPMSALPRARAEEAQTRPEDIAEALAKRDEAATALVEAKARLDQCSVRAPVAGVVQPPRSASSSAPLSPQHCCN